MRFCSYSVKNHKAILFGNVIEKSQEDTIPQWILQSAYDYLESQSVEKVKEHLANIPNFEDAQSATIG